MILYYSPGTCALATHIALVLTETPYSLVSVGRDKKTQDGADFLAINPKGYVPALQLDEGYVMTENPAILAYIADLSGKLLPSDQLGRWRALEATTYMATEVHNNFRPLFYPTSTQEEKDAAQEKLKKHFGILAAQLGNSPFLLGEDMSIADCYLFVMLMWAGMFKIALPVQLETYHVRLRALPAVGKALAEEGLG